MTPDQWQLHYMATLSHMISTTRGDKVRSTEDFDMLACEATDLVIKQAGDAIMSDLNPIVSPNHPGWRCWPLHMAGATWWLVEKIVISADPGSMTEACWAAAHPAIFDTALAAMTMCGKLARAESGV